MTQIDSCRRAYSEGEMQSFRDESATRNKKRRSSQRKENYDPKERALVHKKSYNPVKRAQNHKKSYDPAKRRKTYQDEKKEEKMEEDRNRKEISSQGKIKCIDYMLAEARKQNKRASEVAKKYFFDGFSNFSKEELSEESNAKIQEMQAKMDQKFNCLEREIDQNGKDAIEMTWEEIAKLRDNFVTTKLINRRNLKRSKIHQDWHDVQLDNLLFFRKIAEEMKMSYDWTLRHCYCSKCKTAKNLTDAEAEKLSRQDRGE